MNEVGKIEKIFDCISSHCRFYIFWQKNVAGFLAGLVINLCETCSSVQFIKLFMNKINIINLLPSGFDMTKKN